MADETRDASRPIVDTANQSDRGNPKDRGHRGSADFFADLQKAVCLEAVNASLLRRRQTLNLKFSPILE